MLVLNPYPQAPFPVVKGCVCLVGFASLQSPWAYTPGIHAGAECGAAALTLLGATPQTPFLKLCRFFDSLYQPGLARLIVFMLNKTAKTASALCRFRLNLLLRSRRNNCRISAVLIYIAYRLVCTDSELISCIRLQSCCRVCYVCV